MYMVLLDNDNYYHYQFSLLSVCFQYLFWKKWAADIIE